MTAEELIALNEQIAGMAKAGLPLDQGLASLAGEMNRGPLRRVTEEIADDLRNGSTLPEAMGRRQADLPPYYSNLIAAGVRTGRLPEVLATLTGYARSIAATRSIIYDSLFYPAVVFVFAIVLFGLLAFYVLPQFDVLFTEFNLRLPTATIAVLVIGRHPFLILVLPLALLIGGALITWFILGRTETGRQRRARILYAMPILGTLIRAARLAAFAELLAVLVEYELPLPEAFRLAGQASSDPLMARESEEIYLRLSEGVPLGRVLQGRGLLPEWVAWMASVGEQRGSLAPTLQQIAALYRRQVDARAALLRTVMPAFMIIVTAGFLTAAFAFSVMSPMFNLLEGLQK